MFDLDEYFFTKKLYRKIDRKNKMNNKNNN
jgi:hypothetical protein